MAHYESLNIRSPFVHLVCVVRIETALSVTLDQFDHTKTKQRSEGTFSEHHSL